MDVIFLKSLRPLYCDYISRILCVRRAQQGRPPRPPFMYFYSRPYARGDLGVQGLLRPLAYFYSRPYARGDRCAWRSHCCMARVFLLAPLHEGRLMSRTSISRNFTFLLAPLHEGRRSSIVQQSISCSFLLAPLHEGRRNNPKEDARQRMISTRAPTRGATAYSI